MYGTDLAAQELEAEAATPSKKKMQKLYFNSENVTANHVSKWTVTCVAFSKEGCVQADNMDTSIAHV